MKKAFIFILILSLNLFSQNLQIGFDKKTHPRFNKKEGKIAIEMLANEILKKWLKKTDFKDFDTKIYSSCKNLKDDYVSGKIHVGLMSSRDYSRCHKEISKKTRQFITIKYEDKLYGKLGYVVFKSEEKFPLTHWKGKRVGRSENYLISDFTDLYLLENYKKDMKHFFKKQKVSKSDGLAIMDLFFKKVDIVFASKTAFEASADLNPQLRKRLAFKEISQFLDIPILIFFNNSVPTLDVNFIEGIIKDTFNSPRGEQIKNLLLVEKIMKVSDENLKQIVEKYKKINKLRKKQ